MNIQSCCRIQAAMVLDDMPAHIAGRIIEDQEDIEAIKTHLDGFNLSPYYDKITDKKSQIEHAASWIYDFFENRRKRANTN